MQIRQANVGDAAGIAKVQVDSWKTTYKGIVPNAYLEEMNYENREQLWVQILEKGGVVFVAEDKSVGMIGFSSCGLERTGDYPLYSGELYAIYLLQEYQGKGIGKALVKPLIDYLTKQGITSMLVFVLEENNSKFFYEALGAKLIDTVEAEISGETFNESVYGWRDIRSIF